VYLCKAAGQSNHILAHLSLDFHFANETGHTNDPATHRLNGNRKAALHRSNVNCLSPMLINALWPSLFPSHGKPEVGTVNCCNQAFTLIEKWPTRGQ